MATTGGTSESSTCSFSGGATRHELPAAINSIPSHIRGVILLALAVFHRPNATPLRLLSSHNHLALPHDDVTLTVVEVLALLASTLSNYSSNPAKIAYHELKSETERNKAIRGGRESEGEKGESMTYLLQWICRALTLGCVFIKDEVHLLYQ